MKTTRPPRETRLSLSVCYLATACLLFGQQAPAPTPETTPARPAPKAEDLGREPRPVNSRSAADDSVLVLSPFTVEASGSVGYQAKETLAGTRLRTEMRDLGASISVATEELLKDLNATDNASLMQYMAGAQVGGERSTHVPTYGGGAAVDEADFRNAAQDTRVRGLATTDNTMDYFVSDIWWDGYAIDRVDMLRGPNSILFGLGSPAGIINAGLRSAKFENKGNVELQYRSFDSPRVSFRYNRELLKDELAFHGAYLNEHRKYKQKPAFEDTERFYGALKYVPKFLQSENSTLTFEVKGERGGADANRPRWIPPVDRITQFWDPQSAGGLSGRTLNPLGAHDDARIYGLGEAQERLIRNPNTGLIDWGGHVNPNWVPSIVGTAPGPVMIFGDQNGSAANPVMWDPTVKSYYALNAQGVRDGNFDYRDRGFMFFTGYPDYANRARLPFSDTGGYKERVLTDSSLFDFYNNQLDGPNKHESMDFSYAIASMRQTFFNNHFGYELTAFKQAFKEAQEGTLGDSALMIDFNETLPDGVANPNVGRPYVFNDYRWLNNRTRSDREAYRATVFGEYDFRQGRNSSWWRRALGKHLLTGVVSQEKRSQESFGYARYGFPDSFAAWQLPELIDQNRAIPLDNWLLNLQAIHYLGGSLAGRQTGSGAYIPRITAEHVPMSGQFRTFDSTWVATNVSPGDPWVDTRGFNSTQSENPANYRGWITRDLPIFDTWKEGVYQNYINGANMSKSDVKSQSIVWQGKFWDNSLVAMYGWRKDKAGRASVVAPDRLDSQGRPVGFKDMNSPLYSYRDGMSYVEGESKTYSLALHLDRLPWLRRMPFLASLYYNQSENFQPVANRTDIYNRVLSPPRGSTKDVSVFLSTPDSRYSLRVGKFESKVTDVRADILPGAWAVGFFYERGMENANKYHYKLKNGGLTLAFQATPEDEARAVIDPTYDDGWTMVGLTPAQQKAVTDAWYELVRKTPPGVLQAFQFKGLNESFPENGKPQDITWSTSPDLTFTQDAISKGYEIEFSALPLPNWRLTFNATKTNAIRSNVGGTALADWVRIIDEGLAGLAGDVRIWGTHPGAGNIRQDWQFFRNQYSLAQLLDGQNQPDVREWTFNFITNYEFKNPMLKGVNVGGAYRWEDKAAIGYPYSRNANGTAVNDITNPFYGPDEKFIDLWVGYTRPIRNMNWRIALNVQNVFASKDLIPLNTQPDGTPGAYRIPPPRTWQITSSLDF